MSWLLLYVAVRLQTSKDDFLEGGEMNKPDHEVQFYSEFKSRSLSFRLIITDIILFYFPCTKMHSSLCPLYVCVRLSSDLCSNGTRQRASLSGNQECQTVLLQELWGINCSSSSSNNNNALSDLFCWAICSADVLSTKTPVGLVNTRWRRPDSGLILIVIVHSLRCQSACIVLCWVGDTVTEQAAAEREKNTYSTVENTYTIQPFAILAHWPQFQMTW